MRRIVLIALALASAACAQAPSPDRSTEGSFAAAKEQALALGRVLNGMQACDGDAWKPPFHEFIAAKREQGLSGAQTATIAALVGAAKGAPEMHECSAEGRSKRIAAIDTLRAQW